MSLPNALTLSRLVLAIVLMALLSADFFLARVLALVVFLLAAVSDYLDGYFARRLGKVTPFGQLMDPLTDKVLVCAAFVCFVELKLVPAWVTVTIIGREFLVTGLRLLASHRGRVVEAGRWGKHKTAWQIVAIVVLLAGLAWQQDLAARWAPGGLELFERIFRAVANGLSAIVVAITLISGALYFREHRDVLMLS